MPNIRFKLFENNWIETTLHDISLINPSTPVLPENFIYIDLDSVNDGVLTKVKKININEAPSRAQRYLHKGDILFQTVRPYQMNNYYFNLDDTKYVASTGYAQIRSKIYPKFLYYYLHNPRFIKEVLRRCTGTSYPSINSADLKKIKIKIPSSEKEKMMIGNLFANIDQKRIYMERKQGELINSKNGLMQQLFTQKIKFNPNTWSKFKLGEIVNIPHKDKINSVDGLNLLTVKLHSKGIEINRKTVPKLTKKGRPYYIRKYNEILIGKQNFHNGGIGIVPKELDGGICSNAILSLKVNENKANIKYLFYFLSRPEYYKKSEKFIGGTGQKEFSEKEILKLIVELPILKEQEKIADFLSEIDNKIDSVEQQLEKIKEFKKYLLQQMFI